MVEAHHDIKPKEALLKPADTAVTPMALDSHVMEHQGTAGWEGATARTL